jgi:hypothetical protein
LLGSQARVFHWTAAYFKRRIDDVVVTLTTPMRDTAGRHIGLVSTDWRAEDIIHLISRVEVTPGTFAFLLDRENLLPSANIALKHARLAQISYRHYDPADRVRENYAHNLIWASKLKNALEEKRIVPFFQPIMNIATGRIEKFECLARMLDERGEPVSPAIFLPVARKIRLYRFITRQMIDQSLQWFANNEYEFSLNLSCEDLLDKELHEFIIQRLQTVAEFVHSLAVLAQVRLLGTDYAQGACIGMPANALITEVVLAETVVGTQEGA